MGRSLVAVLVGVVLVAVGSAAALTGSFLVPFVLVFGGMVLVARGLFTAIRDTTDTRYSRGETTERQNAVLVLVIAGVVLVAFLAMVL